MCAVSLEKRHFYIQDMIIQTDISLENYSTFSVSSKAGIMAIIETSGDLEPLTDLLSKYSRHLFLGDGSNILFAGETIDDLIIKNNIMGVHIVEESDSEVLVKAGGGENWHNFVSWTVKNSYYGFENLALIPGTVGAAPVQNIGAYGVEQDMCFEKLTAYDTKSRSVKIFRKEDCDFSYRNSLFKEKKGRYFIIDVTYKLNKGTFSPSVSYKALSDYLDAHVSEEENINQRDVFDAVIAIRSSKLPNPEQIGNAGSFFKNPVISTTEYQKLRSTYPEIPGYTLTDNQVKVPAAWLIDQCGWKGFREGDAGVYPKQALVLVNYGKATGKEICNLAERIQHSVKERFGISITPEVNIIQ